MQFQLHLLPGERLDVDGLEFDRVLSARVDRR